MAAQIIDGKKIAESINEETRKKVLELRIPPRLAIVLASSDQASKVYVELKRKKALELGIETELFYFDECRSSEDIVKKISELNNETGTTGVLIQLPFFEKHSFETLKIINTLSPLKDVDGLTAVQQGRVAQLIPNSFPPASVEATLEALSHISGEDLSWKSITLKSHLTDYFRSKKILILNNSNLIGKPLAQILATLNASVTIANKYTTNLNNILLDSDIVVSATGNTNIISAQDIKKNAILIDITSEKVDGIVKGDFIQSKELLQKAKAITPVPGGIGPITIACLLRNVASNEELLVR